MFGANNPATGFQMQLGMQPTRNIMQAYQQCTQKLKAIKQNPNSSPDPNLKTHLEWQVKMISAELNRRNGKSEKSQRNEYKQQLNVEGKSRSEKVIDDVPHDQKATYEQWLKDKTEPQLQKILGKLQKRSQTEKLKPEIKKKLDDRISAIQNEMKLRKSSEMPENQKTKERKFEVLEDMEVQTYCPPSSKCEIKKKSFKKGDIIYIRAKGLDGYSGANGTPEYLVTTEGFKVPTSKIKESKLEIKNDVSSPSEMKRKINIGKSIGLGVLIGGGGGFLLAKYNQKNKILWTIGGAVIVSGIVLLVENPFKKKPEEQKV